MSDHRHPHRSQQPPTKRQLNYLRALADHAGETFAAPATRTAASRQIDRLKKRDALPVEDRRREDHTLSIDMATRDGGAAAQIRDDELAGWGSSAAWTSPRWT